MDVINRKKLSEVCEHAIMPNKKQTIKLIQRENSFKRALFYDKRKKIELGFIDAKQYIQHFSNFFRKQLNASRDHIKENSLTF